MKEEKIRDELVEFAEKTSVLPMYIAGKQLEPTSEVIICSEISGGADFIAGMPKQLTLVRKLLNGKEYSARYVTDKAAMKNLDALEKAVEELCSEELLLKIKNRKMELEDVEI